MLDVENLGQVFTNEKIVKTMYDLSYKTGRVLEPSCGDGAFLQFLNNFVAIEYDYKVCPESAINMNFFDYPISEKFDTIIGNPPYVKYQNILSDTKDKLNYNTLPKSSNLFLFFIDKCLEHLNSNGEIIFIVPRDFIKSTSAKKLNKKLFDLGTITHWIEFGDEKIFPGFNPNCVIFRFEKNNFSRITNKIFQFSENNGQISFLSNDYKYKFSDYFFAKIGGASGSNEIFTHPNGNVDVVVSTTFKNNKTVKMFYNVVTPELLPFKNTLIKRKIKKFNESNWYTWGRKFYISDSPRIYVNAKTRIKKPFFIHDCNYFDGSIMAIFPKFKIKDKNHLNKICDYFNSLNWDELGFICDNRLLFNNQHSLENILLPNLQNIIE